MILLPIRTESAVHRTPAANYVLIGANIVAFLLLNDNVAGERLQAFQRRYLYFNALAPSLHQFFTYQFLHGSGMHLLGNLLFLWVFGNSGQ